MQQVRQMPSGVMALKNRFHDATKAATEIALALRPHEQEALLKLQDAKYRQVALMAIKRIKYIMDTKEHLMHQEREKGKVLRNQTQERKKPWERTQLRVIINGSQRAGPNSAHNAWLRRPVPLAIQSAWLEATARTLPAHLTPSKRSPPRSCKVHYLAWDNIILRIRTRTLCARGAALASSKMLPGRNSSTWQRVFAGMKNGAFRRAGRATALIAFGDEPMSLPVKGRAIQHHGHWQPSKGLKARCGEVKEIHTLPECFKAKPAA